MSRGRCTGAGVARIADDHSALHKRDKVLEVDVHALQGALLQLLPPQVVRLELAQLLGVDRVLAPRARAARRRRRCSGGPTRRPPGHGGGARCGRPPLRRRRAAGADRAPRRPRVKWAQTADGGAANTHAALEAAEGGEPIEEALALAADLELREARPHLPQVLAQRGVVILQPQRVLDLLLRVGVAEQLRVGVHRFVDVLLVLAQLFLQAVVLRVGELPVLLQLLHREHDLAVLHAQVLRLLLEPDQVLVLLDQPLLVEVGALELALPVIHLHLQLLHLRVGLLLVPLEHLRLLLRELQLAELGLRLLLLGRGLGQLRLLGSQLGLGLVLGAERLLQLLGLCPAGLGSRQLLLESGPVLQRHGLRLLGGEEATAERGALRAKAGGLDLRLLEVRRHAGLGLLQLRELGGCLGLHRLQLLGLVRSVGALVRGLLREARALGLCGIQLLGLGRHVGLPLLRQPPDLRLGSPQLPGPRGEVGLAPGRALLELPDLRLGVRQLFAARCQIRRVLLGALEHELPHLLDLGLGGLQLLGRRGAVGRALRGGVREPLDVHLGSLELRGGMGLAP
mmetsp:Transcript_43695/g.95326  ORF Transcript_43695/g.95326 Transcript_43695/m.95326 type:complete len:568 (+) Transcript_43695:640-2343(+)